MSNCLPRVANWEIAAGLHRSAAISMGLWLCRFMFSANLDAVVVLPEPCRPTNISTDGSWLDGVSR